MATDLRLLDIWKNAFIYSLVFSPIFLMCICLVKNDDFEKLICGNTNRYKAKLEIFVFKRPGIAHEMSRVILNTHLHNTTSVTNNMSKDETYKFRRYSKI